MDGYNCFMCAGIDQKEVDSPGDIIFNTNRISWNFISSSVLGCFLFFKTV